MIVKFTNVNMLHFGFSASDSAKLVSPRSSTDEKVGGPVKNMGGPIKLLCITMFKIGKSCRKLIFGPVKHAKFSRCLVHYIILVSCELDITNRYRGDFRCWHAAD